MIPLPKLSQVLSRKKYAQLRFWLCKPKYLFKIDPQKLVCRWLVNPLLSTSPPGSLYQTPVLNFHTAIRHLHPNSEMSALMFMSLLCCLIFLQCFHPLPNTSLLCPLPATRWWLYSKLSLTSPSLYPLPCSNLLLDLMGCHLSSSRAFYLVFLPPVRNVNILVSLIKDASTLLYN